MAATRLLLSSYRQSGLRGGGVWDKTQTERVSESAREREREKCEQKKRGKKEEKWNVKKDGQRQKEPVIEVDVRGM